MTAIAGVPVSEFLKTQPDKAESLVNQTAVLDLEIRASGFRKKVPSAEVIKDDGTNPKRIKTTKELIDRDKALAEINQHKSRFVAWLQYRTVPCKMLRGGFRMVPLARVEEVDKKLADFKAERAVLVETYLIEPLDQLKAQAKEDLRDHYREDDYDAPEEIRAAFAVDWRWVSFNLPAALEEINVELARREANRRNIELEDTFTEIKEALREGFVDLVDHLRERLEPGPGGKRKILYDSAVNNLRDFLNTFADRNLTNDAQLADLVAKAKAVLNGTSIKDLRAKSDLPRTRLLNGLAALDAQLDQLVETRTRTFATDEEI